MIFLTNPRKGRKKTVAKRLPPRHKSGPKKGQFRKRASSRKRNPAPRTTRQAAPRARATTRGRPTTRRRVNPGRTVARRRNPPRVKIVKQLQSGVVGAAGVLIGKAGARTIPVLAGLPKGGNTGLLIQAATAIALGMAADRVLGKRMGEMVLAGALTAPLETLVVAYNVPFFAPALEPTTAVAELGAYVHGGAALGSYVPSRGLGSYVTPELLPADYPDGGGVGAYVVSQQQGGQQ